MGGKKRLRKKRGDGGRVRSHQDQTKKRKKGFCDIARIQLAGLLSSRNENIQNQRKKNIEKKGKTKAQISVLSQKY